MLDGREGVRRETTSLPPGRENGHPSPIVSWEEQQQNHVPVLSWRIGVRLNVV
jgi:hypothetical protein